MSDEQAGALAGRRVLITGGTSGIGHAIAAAARADGAIVILAGRDRARLQQALSTLPGTGAAGDAIECDLLDVESVRAALSGVGPLDALVNCAGTNLPEPMGDVTEERYTTIFDINVRATFFVSQVALEHMGGDRAGSIVHVSSQMGHVGAANRTVYCASKHAVEGLAKAMAVELAPRGVRVNTVAPTFVETPMTAPMLADPTFRDDVLDKIPLGRLATPGEIAEAVLFLIGNGSRSVTGTSLRVDGGWTAQ